MPFPQGESLSLQGWCALPSIGASRRRRAYAPDEMPADADTFVVLYVDGRPVAGAALGVRADGLADVSRFSAASVGVSACAWTRRRSGVRRGLDEYQTGPSYDGDTDVPVWAERQLT